MTWLGVQRVHFSSCRSTNEEAARLAGEGAGHGTVVIADAQTAGRGRLGRRWYSPPRENLYVSCIVRPNLPPPKVPFITLAAGVAVCDAVNFYGAGASLEWPNDVLVGRKKIAGVLTEMFSQGQKVDHVVLGIGVNVHTTEFPPELSDIATSLAIATGTGGPPRASRARPPSLVGETPEPPDIDLGELADRLIAELEPRLDLVLAQTLDPLRAAWLERAGLPRRATAGDVSGLATELADSGALVVVDDAGDRHEIVSGDVCYEWDNP